MIAFSLSNNSDLNLNIKKNSLLLLLFFFFYRLPDGPSEPDLEPVEPEEHKIIPLEDVSQDEILFLINVKFQFKRNQIKKFFVIHLTINPFLEMIFKWESIFLLGDLVNLTNSYRLICMYILKLGYMNVE